MIKTKLPFDSALVRNLARMEGRGGERGKPLRPSRHPIAVTWTAADADLPFAA